MTTSSAAIDSVCTGGTAVFVGLGTDAPDLSAERAFEEFDRGAVGKFIVEPHPVSTGF